MLIRGYMKRRCGLCNDFKWGEKKVYLYIGSSRFCNRLRSFVGLFVNRICWD